MDRWNCLNCSVCLPHCIMRNWFGIFLSKNIAKYGEELGIDEIFMPQISNMYLNDYIVLFGVSNQEMLTKTIVEVLSEISTEYTRMKIVLSDLTIGQLLWKANMPYTKAVSMKTSTLLVRTTNKSIPQIHSYLRIYYQYKRIMKVNLFLDIITSVFVRLALKFDLKIPAYTLLSWRPILEQSISPPPTNVTIVYNKVIDEHHSTSTFTSMVKLYGMGTYFIEYVSILYVSRIYLGLTYDQILMKSNLTKKQLYAISRTTGGDLTWLGFEYLQKTMLEVESSLGKNWKVDVFTSSLSQLAKQTNLTIAENSLLGILIAYSGQVKKNASVQQFLTERIMANHAPTLNKTNKFNALLTRKFGMYPRSIKKSADAFSLRKITYLLSKMYRGNCLFFYSFTYLKIFSICGKNVMSPLIYLLVITLRSLVNQCC